MFKTALAPTSDQVDKLSSHVGAVRFSYNWAVNYVQSNWEAVKKDPTVPYVNISAYSLRKELNGRKGVIAPWWEQNSKEAFSTGTANANKALQNWFRGRKTGKKVGFPRYKTRHDDIQTGINFTTGTIRLEPTNRHFTIPRIGKVRLHESLKTLRWLLSTGASISQVTISKSQNKWFIAINVRVSDALALQYYNSRHKKKKKQPSVGLDVGLKVFLTDSNGGVVDNPAFLKKSLTKIRKANKRLSRRKKLNKKTGEIASKRWEKAHTQLVKAHAQVVNQRTDFLHKITKGLVENNKLIAVENLKISNMVKNRHLSRAILDASWGEFNRQLEYKAKRYNSIIVKVGAFYPSSKTCSGCKSVKTKLALNERSYHCSNCNLTLDRDLNAAINIKVEAIRLTVAQSCGETLNGRGGGSTGLTKLSETTPNETPSDIKSQP